MLAFLRRLIGGVSGGATSTRGMSTAAGSVEERLYACLFPGERYSPGQAAQLAGRLREVAQSLVVDAEKQPEEPASKKRKKEQRGRGAPPPPLPPRCRPATASSPAALLHWQRPDEHLQYN